MPMGMYMKAFGQMTKPMVMVCSLTLIIQGLKENGSMTSNMESEWKLGIMVLPNIQVSFTKGKSMGGDDSNGMTEVIMREISRMVNLKVLESTILQT